VTTVTKSVDEMIDDAIERLPFLRRRIVQRKLASNLRLGIYLGRGSWFITELSRTFKSGTYV